MRANVYYVADPIIQAEVIQEVSDLAEADLLRADTHPTLTPPRYISDL